jgi:hypothetical protein
MVKRMVVRLLMFGIPFSLSYVLTRPATPGVQAQTFVICAYGDQGREIMISTDKAGCPQTKARPSGWVVPAVGQPQSKSTVSKPRVDEATSDILF